METDTRIWAQGKYTLPETSGNNRGTTQRSLDYIGERRVQNRLPDLVRAGILTFDSLGAVHSPQEAWHVEDHWNRPSLPRTTEFRNEPGTSIVDWV